MMDGKEKKKNYTRYSLYEIEINCAYLSILNCMLFEKKKNYFISIYK